MHVVGARPNFVKSAPILRALDTLARPYTLVHTGQHYDRSMSESFFEDLALREPDVDLGVGSGSHAVQTARVMERLEPVLLERAPALVVVVGDVNSTLAAALVAVKLEIPVAHVEAGLRSFDRSMPEEINRILTDQISDLLFTTSPEAAENLAREGVPADRIHFVGNPMIDSLDRALSRAGAAQREPADGFGVVTLHRPSNVDDPATLGGILEALREIAREVPLLFPAHPRTLERIETMGLGHLVERGTAPRVDTIVCSEPTPYLEFLRLVQRARLVITDSGGVQEETTILGVPCVTVRHNTERPITITMGTNRLAGTDPDAIRAAAREALSTPARPSRPPLWDGRAGERIATAIATWLDARAHP